jgi:hypothetical protein
MNPDYNYPAWICLDCGRKHGRWPEGHIGTFHVGGRCGWCGRDNVAVTEPRDYGYPRVVKEEGK